MSQGYNDPELNDLGNSAGGLMAFSEDTDSFLNFRFTPDDITVANQHPTTLHHATDYYHDYTIESTSKFPDHTTPANAQPGPSKVRQPTEKRKRPGSENRVCDECNVEFRNLRTFGEHMSKQHGVKIFKCDCCESKASRPDNLASHKRTCHPPGLAVTAAAPTTGPDKKTLRRVSVRDINQSFEPMQSSSQSSSHDHGEARRSS
ncbi:hypothetical protein TWF481_000599 [Arthrobotrys musiformis]|uniref:C2H2-type domain-containing protein n=1 Tax=Arthrobotrys musiformis TaxID=47236 RepID=A0AAV9WPW4_9PEZI